MPHLMRIPATLSGHSGLKKEEKKKPMKLGGNCHEGEGVGEEGIRGVLGQNISACMRLSIKMSKNY